MKTKTNRSLIVLLFSVPLAILAIAAVSNPVISADFTSLESLLVWVIAGGGSMILAGKCETYLLENWGKWHTMPYPVKVLFPIVMSGVLAVLAQSVLTLNLIESIPNGIEVVLLAALKWLSGQREYLSLKDTSYAHTARGE